MVSISSSSMKIAGVVAAAFGCKPDVTRFWDDNRKSHVDIVACKDRPQAGVTSYATLSLSDWPLFVDGEEYKVRVEMVGACGNRFSSFDNALATAAFCVINSRWSCYPGAIFPDALAMYESSATMRHFLFVPPFLWEASLKTIDLEDRTVAWLLAVPISEEERQLAVDRGSDELESLLFERQIDIFDLERASAA